MTSSRRPAAPPADIARAGIPLLLLLGAVSVPDLAWLFLIILVGGVAVAAGRHAPVGFAWAASVPAAASTALRGLAPATAGWDEAACGASMSPLVAWAVGDAVIVIAATVALASVLGSRAADLGIRRPPKYATRWALLGAAAILGIGLAGVLLLSITGSGVPATDIAQPGLLLPAVVWAVAIASAEEVAWRGAMQGWLARTLGPLVAVLAQAVLYGIAWGVLLGWLLGGLLAGAAGLVLGATVVRTRTIAVALAWHLAFNVPFYVFVACRTG